jgi:hypothetical protein
MNGRLMLQRPSYVPVIVRILDYVSVAVLLLSLTILVTGGFREWMPWGRVSMTSWIRPFAIALIALAVRHWVQPRPTTFSRIVRGARVLASVQGVRQVMPLFLGTRTFVLVAGVLAIALIGFRNDAGPPWRVYENEFLNLPARWDTGWYIGIAVEGYRWQPSRDEIQQNIAFFPAYPMLMRYTALFLGRELMWSGVLISWVSFFGALVYLYRFTRERFDDERGRAAITLLSCYPFALFFSTAYTEALFLVAILGACYHFERDELWRAGGWGVLAGLTRPNGCLLSVVLALIAVRPWWPPHALTAANWGRLAQRMAVAALPGIGMLMYSAYIYSLTGHPLQWAAQNVAWGRVYRGLDTFVSDQADLLNHGIYTLAASPTVDALQLAAVVFVVIALWPVFRRIGFPYAVMIAVNVLPPVLMGGLMSMGRVTSVLFPAFVWLALVIPTRHITAWAVMFAMVQAICAAVFFTWRPMF